MTVRRFVVTPVTDGSGDATEYSPYFSGKICSVHYVKVDYANNCDFAITADVSGETIWAEDNFTASAHRYPRMATDDTAGAAALRAAGGTAVLDLIHLSRDRVKVVVASGGDTFSGHFHFVVED